ncbi:Calmodulin [Hondaea fermentalgiana]|uniref:Calmodulin n=1 Tax=Hondaea fermentalgiana TaxID=2315210 RepID=A0A2R5GAT0_9STRA|nr:Calmodulin [Hondaea fermentalgiana]|eukprot:GBG28110.1 Calmodulin [Hondaea fermentalgiana]
MDAVAAARCFDAFDRGNKGWLTSQETEFAMAALLGLRPPRFEVARLVEASRARAERGAQDESDQSLAEHHEERDDDNGAEEEKRKTDREGVDKETFLAAMSSKLCRVDQDDVIRATFAAFDVGCRGFLVYEDVLTCFRHVLPSVSPQLVKDAFALADRDNDGRVGYGEFALLMRSHANTERLQPRTNSSTFATSIR